MFNFLNHNVFHSNVDKNYGPVNALLLIGFWCISYLCLSYVHYIIIYFWDKTETEILWQSYRILLIWNFIVYFTQSNHITWMYMDFNWMINSYWQKLTQNIIYDEKVQIWLYSCNNLIPNHGKLAGCTHI